jgi:hypothetical protein
LTSYGTFIAKCSFEHPFGVQRFSFELECFSFELESQRFSFEFELESQRFSFELLNALALSFSTL